MDYDMSHVVEDKEFWEIVLEDDWPKVIEKYQQDSSFHKIDIKGRGTALHVAVSSGLDGVVKSLVEAIEKFEDNEDESSLKELNEIGATPLHLAAYRGLIDICLFIIGENGERKYLIQEKNKNGETPLFWAVTGRQNLVFLYLQQFFPLDPNIAMDYNNTSILHVAIHREMFDLALIIMNCYQVLISMKDKDDITPLEVLATKTSAFKSGSRLTRWKEILYYCCTVSHYDAKRKIQLYQKRNAKNVKEVYSTVQIYVAGQSEKAYKIQHSVAQSCHNIQRFVLKWPILSLFDLKAIRSIKKNHIYGGQLMDEFMKTPIWSYIGGGYKPIGVGDDISHYDEMKDQFRNFPMFVKHEQDEEMKNIKKAEVKSDGKDTAYLIAASHGIVEMMSKLKLKIPSVINETNSNNENALLLAVKNRQPHVIQRLHESLPKEVFNHLVLQTSKMDNNTILHLAADTSFERENTWRISGVAMQLMWDIKWYKYIKELVPDHFINRCNKVGKTSSEIFKEKHKIPLESSVSWLKDTSESCSVVAALIAGVSFGTSGSVPGGNQQTGKPALEGQPAFEGFAISSLIGLYFSVTALIMFLAILTSRKEVEDFRQNLPMKLLFGLCSLFVSIVAMFVSFCAGHFFVLTDKYTKGGILFYLYISICLPVTFYAAVQFPLFIDLVKVIWKKVPPSSVKGVLL